jgi:hypothetical protein
MAHAKECALIVADEILSLAYSIHDFTETKFINTDYWEDVKREIKH